MIAAYLDKSALINFDGIDFVVSEEPFNKRIIIDFFNKKIQARKSDNDTITQVEIYITKEEEVIVHHRGSYDRYTIVTGQDARELSEIMKEEIERRNRNMKFFHDKLMTKSTPPTEIKLPEKKNG